jgi:hypothetical protein
VKTQREREEWSAGFLSLELPSDRAKHKLLWEIAVWCEDFFDHLLQGHMFY